MDSQLRHWFLTSTTYGTWLPGDARSFVSSFPQDDGEFEIHNHYDTPYDRDDPEWEKACKQRLKGKPIYFTSKQAEAVVEQFLETTRVRGWTLYIVSVMASHFHALASAPAAIRSKQVLGDYKAYASRKLTSLSGKPASETWWTKSGSRRPVYDGEAFNRVYEYILEQPGCLAQWRMALDHQVIIGSREPGRS